MRIRSILFSLFLCVACTKKAAPPVPVAAPAAEPNGLAAALGPDEEIKPVYSAFAGPALPIAESLCHAVHGLPEERRAACCSAKIGTQNELVAECVKLVSAAVRAGGIALDAGKVQACADAESKATQGCGWVTQGLPALPDECARLVQGTVASGGVCRSALECVDGLTCLGAGPTVAGHCGPPKANGTACLSSTDSLANFVRDYDDARHPECAGFCGHRHCEAKFASGAACFLARQCGAGQHCDGKTCIDGPFANAGEACVGDGCGPGLRCINRVCALPKAAGLACVQDFECTGGCIPGKNVCGLRCDVR
jgi:hypothetical protein